MPGQGRLGDKANVPADAHGCPACPHPAIGPAIQGSPNVNVNGRPALRVDDVGMHAACCGPNMWTATAGSATVFINGKKAHRIGDQNRHCGGMGQLVEGSANVIVGDSGGAGGGGGGGGSSSSSSAAAGGGGGGGSANAASSSSASSASSESSSAAPSSSAPAQASSPPPKHWTEFHFHDAGGRPVGGAKYRITLPDGREVKGKLDGDGRARHEQLPEGGSRVELADIDEARWGSEEVDAHQPVELSVGTSGLDGGEPVRFEIFRLYRERSGDAVATLQAQLDGSGRATTRWTPGSIDAPDGRFVFKATAGGVWRKSGELAVVRRATTTAWSSDLAHDGDALTLRAELRGVRDGERATVTIRLKRWRDKQDAEAQRLDATVSNGAVVASWTVPAASDPVARGQSARRDFYFTVEAGGVHRTSGLLAVVPRGGRT